MPTNWDSILGDDDSYGEIGADDEFGDDDFSGDGTAEIVGDAIVGADDSSLLQALSIGAAAASRTGRHRAASKIKRFANKVATARKVDPNAVVVRERTLDKRRRFPLGVVPTNVLATATSTIPAAPQDLFRPERLVIDSSIAFDFGVQDVKVGNTSQLVSGGEVPAALFTEVAIDTFVHFKTAEIGNQITLTVRNKTAGTIEFSAGLVGTVVQS